MSNIRTYFQSTYPAASPVELRPDYRLFGYPPEKPITTNAARERSRLGLAVVKPSKQLLKELWPGNTFSEQFVRQQFLMRTILNKQALLM